MVYTVSYTHLDVYKRQGDSNRLARSAGMAVANKPGGTSFNPLLIFGGVGLGKTHLAHAIGVEIKDKYPEKTVLYISAEVFTQQYICLLYTSRCV